MYWKAKKKFRSDPKIYLTILEKKKNFKKFRVSIRSNKKQPVNKFWGRI